MENMRKRAIFPVLLMLVSAFSLSGCGKDSDKAAASDKVEASKPLKEITEDVMNCGVKFPEMIEVAEGNFQIKYGLVEGDYEEYSLWWAGSGADADEVCIIKTKDIVKVKSAVDDRLKGQKEVFKDYVPKQYDKLRKTKVETKGDYVYLLCTNDNSKAKKALIDNFK